MGGTAAANASRVTQHLHRPVPAGTPWLRRVGGALLGLACACAAFAPSRCAAQSAHARQLATAAEEDEGRRPAPQRILLLRVSGADRSLADGVERVLAGALDERGFSVASSPLPFHDAQLIAGCTGTLRDCGSQVANALDSEHLAVAQLEDDGAMLRLQLYLFGDGGAVRKGAAQLPRAAGESRQSSVRALVARVLGVEALAPAARAQPAISAPAARGQPAISAPAARAQPAISPQASEALPDRRPTRVLRSIGWASLGTGGALLIGAVATSAAAQRASQAYAQTDVDSRADADQALAHYEAAQHRAEVARVLWGVGAASVAAGTFMLLWQRLAAPSDRKSPDRNLQYSFSGRGGMRLTASPAPAGVSIALRGEL
jgi:hypothetical protein